jgi:hypothetical protein
MAGGPVRQPYAGVDFPQSGIYEFGYWTLQKLGRPSRRPVPEFIDPVFTKTSPKRSFSLNRKRAFWLVFAKTGSIISGSGDKYEYIVIFDTKNGDYFFNCKTMHSSVIKSLGFGS